MRNPDGSYQKIPRLGPGMWATCWAIKWPNGGVDATNLSTTRALCVQKFLDQDPTRSRGWFLSEGYDCVKVRVAVYEVL